MGPYGTEALQKTKDSLTITAGILGMKFNAENCALLALKKGKPGRDRAHNYGEEDQQESYLGVPIGSNLRIGLVLDSVYS